MNILITNKQPVPSIYNVKQYTSSDIFVFYVPLTELELLNTDKLTANIIAENFTTSITPTFNDTYAVIEWKTKAKETAKSGRFEVQIELSDGESVWRSYKALLVISDSVDGGDNTDDTPSTSNGGNGIIEGVFEMTGEIDNNIISCEVDELGEVDIDE